MKLFGLLLVAGVVGVYIYLKNVDESSGSIEDRGRVIVPTLAGTVVVLAVYILVTSLQK
jgi:hypothetical protein